MLLVNQYLYLPGCCELCRSSNLPVIDTGKDLDRANDPNDPNPSAISRLYICADCALELARMVKDSRGLDIVKAGTVPVMQNMIDELSNMNVELTGRVEDLENALRVVKTIQPAAPASSPAKKNFKVVTPDEVDV